jgi:hypothetical protein
MILQLDVLKIPDVVYAGFSEIIGMKDSAQTLLQVNPNVGYDVYYQFFFVYK